MADGVSLVLVSMETLCDHRAFRIASSDILLVKKGGFGSSLRKKKSLLKVFNNLILLDSLLCSNNIRSLFIQSGERT